MRVSSMLQGFSLQALCVIYSRYYTRMQNMYIRVFSSVLKARHGAARVPELSRIILEFKSARARIDDDNDDGDDVSRDYTRNNTFTVINKSPFAHCTKLGNPPDDGRKKKKPENPIKSRVQSRRTRATETASARAKVQHHFIVCVYIYIYMCVYTTYTYKISDRASGSSRLIRRKLPAWLRDRVRYLFAREKERERSAAATATAAF